MVGLRFRVGQRRGAVAVLQVSARLPFPVLPEVLFPARDAEQLDEQARILGVLVQGPVDCPGPQPGELPRVFRTGNLRLIHAASCPFRYPSRDSCGVL
jgi:hypothetical protein